MSAHWQISKQGCCLCRTLWNESCVQTDLQLEAEQIPTLASPKKLNLPCQHLTRKRSCKTLYPPRLFPINCDSSVHPTNIPKSIYKCWVLSIRLLLIAGITLRTGIFTIYKLMLIGLKWDWNSNSSVFKLLSRSITLESNIVFPCVWHRLWEGTQLITSWDSHANQRHHKNRYQDTIRGCRRVLSLCSSRQQMLLASESQTKDKIVLSWIWQVIRRVLQNWGRKEQFL